MNIKNKNKIIKIKNISELEGYIIEYGIISDFKSFCNVTIDKLDTLHEVLKDENIKSNSKLTKQLRGLKIFTYPSKLQYMYWYIRGYDMETSNSIVSNIQSDNSLKRINKYSTKELRQQSVRCVEYWERLGFNTDDARKKISKLQDNTSLETLIKKYGNTIGTEIRNDITNRWQNSLNSKPPEEKIRINKLRGKGGLSNRNIPKSDDHKQKIREAKLKYYKTHDVYNKNKSMIDIFGEDRTMEIISKWNTLERSTKIRKNRIKEIQNSCGQIMPNYNKLSISIIEEYGKKYGYNFQHAENGGEYHIKELGYFVDGYDIDKNVVLEIDEPHHYKNNVLRKKDKIRQQQIENLLGCKFIRIKI